MLWRIPADTHEQRIGIMAFIGYPRPVTNVAATNVFRRQKATALTALTPAAAPFRAANHPHASAKTTAHYRKYRKYRKFRPARRREAYCRNFRYCPTKSQPTLLA